jgi:LysM repeat protein
LGVVISSVFIIVIGIFVLDFYLDRTTEVPDALIPTATPETASPPPSLLPARPTPTLEIVRLDFPVSKITPPATPVAVSRGDEKPTEDFYVVEPGDSLSAIASRYDVPIEAIISANGIDDAGLIRVGQELIIPLD